MQFQDWGVVSFCNWTGECLLGDKIIKTQDENCEKDCRKFRVKENAEFVVCRFIRKSLHGFMVPCLSQNSTAVQCSAKTLWCRLFSLCWIKCHGNYDHYLLNCFQNDPSCKWSSCETQAWDKYKTVRRQHITDEQATKSVLQNVTVTCHTNGIPKFL